MASILYLKLSLLLYLFSIFYLNCLGAIPLTLRTSYPAESPPPYPGGLEGCQEEKVPLSETQFVNGDPEESPQRLQMSPLLSSPEDESPTTCQARLSNCNDDHMPWSNVRNCSQLDQKNIYANSNRRRNQARVNNELSMQSFPRDKYRGSATSPREANGIIQRPSTLCTGAPRQTSSSDILLFQDNINITTDNNVRQNSNNEQRQLYNMVIVGVEPDLTTGINPRPEPI